MVEHSRRPNGRGSIGNCCGGIGQRPVNRVVATTACCRDIVVVLPLVGGDHCTEVVGCAFDMLSYRASGAGALVVAPVIICKRITLLHNLVRLKHFN